MRLCHWGEFHSVHSEKDGDSRVRVDKIFAEYSIAHNAFVVRTYMEYINGFLRYKAHTEWKNSQIAFCFPSRRQRSTDVRVSGLRGLLPFREQNKTGLRYVLSFHIFCYKATTVPTLTPRWTEAAEREWPKYALSFNKWIGKNYTTCRRLVSRFARCVRRGIACLDRWKGPWLPANGCAWQARELFSGGQRLVAAARASVCFAVRTAITGIIGSGFEEKTNGLKPHNQRHWRNSHSVGSLPLSALVCSTTLKCRETTA